MWMSHPDVAGVVTVADSAFFGGWDTLGWVADVAPEGPPLPDAGWPVSEGEVTTLVGAAVAAQLPAAAADAIEDERTVSNATYGTISEAPISPERYGAAGNDVTDDTVAIETALAAFLTSLDRFDAAGKRPARFQLTRGKRYRITRAINMPLTGTPANYSGGVIDGYGSEIRLDGAGGVALLLDPGASATGSIWRQFAINGLNLLNSGMQMISRNNSMCYGWAIRDFVGNNCPTHGMLFQGCFEGVIHNPTLAMTSAAASVYDAVHFEIGPEGLGTSSIEVYGGTTRRGRHGLYADNADVDVYGFTALDSQDYGVKSASTFGNVFSGLHIERCQTGKASLAAGAAGMLVTGGATVQSLDAYDWTDVPSRRMTAALEVAPTAAGPAIVMGGRVQNIPVHTIVGGDVGSDVTLIGVPSWVEKTGYLVAGGRITVLGKGQTQFLGANTTRYHRTNATDPTMTTRAGVETEDRFALTAQGAMRWGGFNTAYDTEMVRTAANTLAMTAGDSFKVDGTWNGGVIKMGAYSLWVDATGKLRIKTGTVNSDLDGTLVGP